MKLQNKPAVLRAVLGLILFGACAPVIMAQGFTFFDVPNASFIQTYGINDHGQIPGYFFDTHLNKGRSFIFEEIGVSLVPPGTNGNLIIFDVPNSSYTQAQGINSGGDVVGLFYDPAQGNKERAFVYQSNGSYLLFDAPRARATSAQSINVGGDVTGSFSDSSQAAKARGYILERSSIWVGVALLPPGTNEFILFDAPNASATFPQSINLAGEVAGWFYGLNTGNRQHGFVRDSLGNIVVFDAPNAWSTRVLGMNDSGEVVGYFSDLSLGYKVRGFLRHPNGTITVIDGPNATYTETDVINDGGTVAGVLLQPTHNTMRGYVLSPYGTFTIFDVPNASATYVQGLNDSGEVAGTFTDASQANEFRGYVRHAR